MKTKAYSTTLSLILLTAVNQAVLDLSTFPTLIQKTLRRMFFPRGISWSEVSWLQSVTINSLYSVVWDDLSNLASIPGTHFIARAHKRTNLYTNGRNVLLSIFLQWRTENFKINSLIKQIKKKIYIPTIIKKKLI